MKKIYLYTLFSFALTIASSLSLAETVFVVENPQPTENLPQSLSFPFEAQVKSRVGEVLSQPNSDARVLLLVRQADRLRILGEEASFFKVEFLLENQYPIHGFIRKEHLGDLNEKTDISRAKEQAYSPDELKEEIQTKAFELEDEKDQQQIRIPAPLRSLDESTISQSSQIEEKKKSPEQWIYSFKFDLGWQQYQERVFTRIDGSYPSDPLINSSLEGLNLIFEFSIFKRWLGFLNAGSRAQYELSALQANVKQSNAQIEAADVLAQWHRFSAEIFAYPSFQIKQWLLQPELALGFQFYVLSTNQLRDKNLAQPILFSDLGYYAELALRPRLLSPYFLSAQGELGILLFYQFSEGPLQSTSQGVIQTGKPKPQTMLLQYGWNLAWDLESLGLNHHSILLTYRLQDLSKSFSGEGNRAGFRLEEARSKSKIHSLSLGYRFAF